MITKIYSIFSWIILWTAFWGFNSCVLDGQWLALDAMCKGVFFGLAFAWLHGFDFQDKDFFIGYQWLKQKFKD